jgi:hypothetical protein
MTGCRCCGPPLFTCGACASIPGTLNSSLTWTPWGIASVTGTNLTGGGTCTIAWGFGWTSGGPPILFTPAMIHTAGTPPFVGAVGAVGYWIGAAQAIATTSGSGSGTATPVLYCLSGSLRSYWIVAEGACTLLCNMNSTSGGPAITKCSPFLATESQPFGITPNITFSA